MIKKIFILAFLLVPPGAFPQSTKGYTIVWQDNFSGSILDTTSWVHETAAPRWVNNELQRYTDGENVKLTKGKLLITARKEGGEYTSGRIKTQGKREFRYGVVKIRAKIPRGTGTWPALWMLGQNIDEVGWPAGGELDIMEHVGKRPHFIHATIHNASGYGDAPYTGIMELKDPFGKYHIYGMEWTPEYINLTIDGKVVTHYQPEKRNADTWPFDQPFFLIFNIAIGGNWGGPLVDDSALPAVMTVDWVKVYQKKPSHGTAADTMHKQK